MQGMEGHALVQEAAVPALPAAEETETDSGKTTEGKSTCEVPLQEQSGLRKESDALDGSQILAAVEEGEQPVIQGKHGKRKHRNRKQFSKNPLVLPHVIRANLKEQVQAAVAKGVSSEAPAPDEAPADEPADTGAQQVLKPSEILLGPSLRLKQQLDPHLAAAVVAADQATGDSAKQVGPLRCDTALLEGLQEVAGSAASPSAQSPGSSLGADTPMACDGRARSGASDPGRSRAARWDGTGASTDESSPAQGIPSAGGRATEDAAAGFGGVWGMQVGACLGAMPRY